MTRFGYDKQRCDSLKRDRKNLTNKLYRRRVKLDSIESSSNESKKILKDIESIKNSIDSLNSQIWKCSKNYASLKEKEYRLKSKIRYRKNKLKKVPVQSDQGKKYRSELSSLYQERANVEKKIFYGSPRYSNIKVNYRKIDSKISSLKNKLASGVVTYVEDGQKKTRTMTSTERTRILNLLHKLGDEKKQLGEILTGDPAILSSYEKEFPQLDPDKETELLPANIYNYGPVFERALEQREVDTVFITGDRIGSDTFSYPTDYLSIIKKTMEADAAYAEDASNVQVRIYINRLERSVKLEFIA